MPHDRKALFRMALAMFVAMLAASAAAQRLAGPALVSALRHGGYVIVMRRAHMPTP